MTIFTRLDTLVRYAKSRAMCGFYNGVLSENNLSLIEICSHGYHDVEQSLAAKLIFTRDIGHHTSGWWKNPDYERCWHLSLSQVDRMSGEPAPTEKVFFAEIAKAFFGGDAAKLWLEGPYSPEGKSCDVWHYRLFCDAGWQPIIPRGEVYSNDRTAPRWRSFSEIHGVKIEEVDAPFLKEGL